MDDEIPLQGGSHASSSHEASSEPILKRRQDLGKQCFILIFPKTDIARFVRGLKLQEPREEGALGEPYFVQKILVI